MSIRNLFIKGDETPTDKTSKPVTKEQTTKFPSTVKTETDDVETNMFGFAKTPVKQQPTFVKGTIQPEHLAKANQVYQNGFESLNQPGYDFFEFYQTIVATGVANPQTYAMAFAMAKSMDKTVTKDSLLEQSNYYTTEITKSYDDTVTKGNAKRDDLNAQKEHENESLKQELENLNQQFEAIKTQIADREGKLAAIGSKYEPILNELGSKLAANESAKNSLIQSIEQVKQGIINNLK